MSRPPGKERKRPGRGSTSFHYKRRGAPKPKRRIFEVPNTEQGSEKDCKAVWEKVPDYRTMQTAVGAFGGESYSDGVNVVPLMVANAGNSARSAVSSLNCPPFLAVEACREHLGVHPCDKRRCISEYQLLFPAIDFSLIEDDEDVLWKPEIREPNEDVAARGVKLWTRKEKEIVVVTHSGFLYHTLRLFGNDCHLQVKEEISKHFANCELRSMVLVDRSMRGSDIPTTNYPGKIPPGLDLPSDMDNDPCSEKLHKA
ncbi:hypothetical protein Taro_023227 [Colocasia esculenta]|uniref:Phosphoglycerate mutase-like protein n=1 Tax=Colocasia esculenta TaxID=4460 RepID=A0A843V3B6_COLES|nr:hypothetical protein [Colocasia esculenta]